MESYHQAPMDSYGPPDGYRSGHGDHYAAGSAYPPDHYAASSAGYYSPDGAGRQGPTETAATGHDPLDYQQFTEQGRDAHKIAGIDPETGIAPRRLTDCVCLVVFVLYVLGMITLLVVAKNRTLDERPYGDIRRLTHGMDYKAKLCGVDAEVQDAPFLFWCRSKPSEWWTPDSLNLENPTCVKRCPSSANGNVNKPIACLFPEETIACSSESGSPCQIPGGQFGNIVNYHLQSQQSIVNTAPYETEPLGGRYCMPVDRALRATVYKGPLNLGVRTVNAVGSFQDCWGVIFLAALISCLISYFYVLCIKDFVQSVLYCFLGLSLFAFMVAGSFFMYAVVIPFHEQPVMSWFPSEPYSELNPLFSRTTRKEAAIVSIVLGVVCWLIAGGIMGAIGHLAPIFTIVKDLVEASAECFMSMRSMLVVPAIEALWKFMLMWILCYNFMFLVSVGSFDEYRIVINGDYLKGKSAQYTFDWWMLPWIVYYLYGAVWIMELCNAFGQFLISFSVISWYFMKKEGKRKMGVPPLPPLHATLDAIVYHFGSLCLGAAIIPWTRLVRIFTWVEDESVPGADSECPEALQFCNCCCKCVGGACQRLTNCRKSYCIPACCNPKKGGCSFKFGKQAYADIIIRSQHFIPASQRSMAMQNSHKYTSMYTSKCQIVTVVGVMSVGMLCASLTYLLIVTSDSLNNPTSSSYIADPIAVSLVAFFLCGSISYGFCALFDHTADTLLYCYAWNRKFNKETLELFVPESIREIVRHDVPAPTYQFYGNTTRPEMFLATWLPMKKKNDKHGSDKNQGASPPVSPQGGSTYSASAYPPGAYDTAGGYPGGAYGTAYSQSSGYSPQQDPGYHGGYGHHEGGR